LDSTKYKRNNKPKISVIIPYYNKDNFSLYIPLRSIQNQSFKDIEIIFVDDGSSEKKINQLIEEMKNDNRIILLKHKTRKGTLISRVDGVRYSSGEYIIQLDQDDLYINNLLFEELYRKAKNLNIDIVQFSTFVYENENSSHIMRILIPKNISITQPELKKILLMKLNERFGRYWTMIWDKFVRRETYLEAIEDLGDEYLNHIFFAYEDTLMMFELSQIALSYYYYDIIGYRYNIYRAGQSRISQSHLSEILAMNQLYFIKLLLYKGNPLYDRYYIYKEWGFFGCGSEVK
jgi:glycosyltransferase involved in cell wall biosynthesis